jgi:hypothetical protein
MALGLVPPTSGTVEVLGITPRRAVVPALDVQECDRLVTSKCAGM